MAATVEGTFDRNQTRPQKRVASDAGYWRAAAMAFWLAVCYGSSSAIGGGSGTKCHLGRAKCHVRQLVEATPRSSTPEALLAFWSHRGSRRGDGSDK
ncbi:hypothetical protein K458DRAFT_56304 [Lentithecium fluviatile CBS 122367]|uniref:Uncharacterized protein n=1 Tax=Lentithecium fluviatile CBS 122367 TaxID=1168545 RepID=A0A6G1IXJ5_9PLEO|nr:hypothetical protein K458DRAFT_56304 [Lentithecium fluviatile CBS 122367]